MNIINSVLFCLSFFISLTFDLSHLFNLNLTYIGSLSRFVVYSKQAVCVSIYEEHFNVAG